LWFGLPLCYRNKRYYVASAQDFHSKIR